MRENQYLSTLMELYDEYKKVLSGIEDAKMMITAEDDPEMKEMAREELKELEEKQPKLEEQIKLKLIPPDPLDEKNIILEIRSAAGGDEASLFVRDLWEMYCHLADRKGWKTAFPPESRIDPPESTPEALSLYRKKPSLS